MKVCIYGAGAIGGWMGSRLAHAGCSVSVVARGTTLDALQLHGLRLHDGKDITSHAVASTDTPAELGVQDLVVLAVKAPSLPEVARQIAPLLGPDTLVHDGDERRAVVVFAGLWRRAGRHAAGLGRSRRRAGRGPAHCSTSSAAWCMPAARSMSPDRCSTTSATS